jgi:hypothetical protein
VKEIFEVIDGRVKKLLRLQTGWGILNPTLKIVKLANVSQLDRNHTISSVV